MRIIFYLMLLIFLASCQYSPPVVELENDDFHLKEDNLKYGDWGDESLRTREIRCRGELQGDEVLCDIVNVSDHDVVLNRGLNGFGYAVLYRTKLGDLSFREFPKPIEGHFEHIEILGPLKLPKLCIASWASTSFTVKLPSDCAKLLCVVIRIPFSTYAEMGKCSNACDLYDLFDRNTRHVLVEFPFNRPDQIQNRLQKECEDERPLCVKTVSEQRRRARRTTSSTRSTTTSRKR